MRYLDAMLDSSVFWGVVFLVLLLFGYRMEGIVRAIAFALSWGAGSYASYRWWSANTAQNPRLIGSFLMLYTGFLLFAYFWTDPLRPISRAIRGLPVGRGKFVAAVSLLDVGGSPSHEPIPNPPGWVPPKRKIQLVFQDSPLLTDTVKDQITQDLSAIREYLLGLGIPVSDEFPPVGVGPGPGSSRAHLLGLLPSYRSSVTVTQGWFLNRRSITHQYVDYAIADALNRRTPQHPAASTLQDMMAAAALSQYYNWSFWDYKPAPEGGYWATQLWEIRSTFGKDFTDRLVAFTLRSILDNPEEGADANFDIYFHDKLRQGDSVINSQPERMGKMTEIIEKSGINVSAPKVCFEFSASAVKRQDGSYVVDAVATNKSDVAAMNGQFRMYFAPDVELLLEPRGSQKDSQTTLKSSRVIPFTLIPAHTSSHLKVGFGRASVSPTDVKSFVLHFDYQCETCIRDTYSHDLEFPLGLFEVNN